MKTIITAYKVYGGRGGNARAGYVANDGDGHRVFIQKDNSKTSFFVEDLHREAALALCAKMGWRGALVGGHILRNGVTVGMAWVWTTPRALTFHARAT